MRHVTMVTLMATLFTSIGCQPVTPPGDGGDSVPLDPPALFDTEMPAFALSVSTDRGSGVVGTVFQLQAVIADATINPASFSWTINEGAPFSTDPSPATSFDAPGEYIVDVTVADDQGNRVTEGVLLTVFDTDATSATARAILPDAGRPSTLVQIQSPVLDAPEAIIQIIVGDGEPFEPFRPELGTANFLIPPDAADGLGETTTIDIKLLADGQTQDTFEFALSQPAPLTGAPGALFGGVLQGVPNLISEAEISLVSFAARAEVELTPDEQAVLQGILQFTQIRYDQVNSALTPILDELSDADKTLLDQALLANGITTDDLSDLEDLAKRLPVAKNSNDELIDDLCRFHDLVDRLKSLLEALNVAAQFLDTYGLLSVGTPTAPAVLAASSIISELNQALGNLVVLAGMVPRVLDDLQVTAIPSALQGENENAVVRVKAQLTKTDLCDRAQTGRELAKYFSDEFVKFATESLFKRVTSRAFAREMYRHTYRLGRTDPAAATEAMSQIQTFLARIVSNILNSIIDATVLDSLFQEVLVKLCASRDRDTLALQPEEMILTLTPSNGGRFLNLQDESIDFFCDINHNGAVNVKAERPCGLTRVGQSGPRVLTGETTITCGSESCTENASNSILVEVIPTTQFDVPNSSCLNIQETLLRQDAMIKVTNTHPDRTIKLAAVHYRESDVQDITRGACEGDNLLPNETIAECRERVGAGCSNAFSGPTVGFSSFLLPGETSFAIEYICSHEFIYVPPDSDGTCGSAELETVTENWVIQAVFCDNSENADNFCSQVDPQMEQFGFPQNPTVWVPIEPKGCDP